MKDHTGRSITQIYISVTERCNLRCRYCRPEEGLSCTEQEDRLGMEEILRLADIFASLGIIHITLTGGEPLLREDLMDLIGNLKQQPDLGTVSLVSNGTLAYPVLSDLKSAGIDEILFHMDTTQSHQYKWLTRGQFSSAEVLRSIWKAVSLDIPVRILCVLQEETQNEILIFAGLSRQYSIGLDLIEVLPIRWCHEARYFSTAEALRKLTASYPDLQLEITDCENGIYQSYRSEKLKGSIRIINPAYTQSKMLESCAFLSDAGKLGKGIAPSKTCDLRELLRHDAGDAEIKAVIRGYLAGS